MTADIDVRVKVAIYRAFAETGLRPAVPEIAARSGLDSRAVRASLPRLAAQRLLLLEPDGETIRMAPPFSGVPTRHRVTSSGVEYAANCAWDALGIVAALRRPGTVRSRCGQSGEPLLLEVGGEGPEESGWLFHCLVPAAEWWNDLVFT